MVKPFLPTSLRSFQDNYKEVSEASGVVLWQRRKSY